MSRMAGKSGKMILSLPATGMLFFLSSFINGVLNGLRFCTKIIMSDAVYFLEMINSCIFAVMCLMYWFVVVSCSCFDISLCISTSPYAF